MNQNTLPLLTASNDAHTSRISEINIPGGTIAARHLLAGMLRELNDYEDSRWVCWISNSPVKPLLDAARKQSGEHILQVVSRHSDLCTLAQRALNSGKSHTVVLRVEGELTAGQRQALEYAAANGDADCLLVKFS